MSKKIELSKLKVTSFVTGDKTVGGCMSQVSCPDTSPAKCPLTNNCPTMDCESMYDSLCCQSAPEMC